MATYTGKDRVEAALKREYADRVPILVGAQAQCAEVLGFTPEDLITDLEKQLELTVAAQEMFPSDIVSVPGNPYLPSTQATRQELQLGHKEAIRPRLEDKSLLEQLEVRDPRQSRGYGRYLEMCEKVNSMFEDKWVQALMAAPWVTAVALRGIERIIFDTRDDPDFVHELMRYCTELSKARGAAIAETGVALMLAETSGSCSVISPGMFRDFVSPYLEEVVSFLKEQGACVNLHICGYIDPIMEDLVDTGIDIIDLDGPSSLERLVELSQKRVVIRGNVPTELFLEASKERMEQAVKGCIDTAAEGSAYILAPGCAIPSNAPVENIRYYWEAGQEYGRADRITAS